MSENNGVEVLETKQFKLLIRFADGEKDGKPHDRAYGFAIEAKSELQARQILQCVEELDKDILREAQGIPKNDDVGQKTTS